MFKHVFITFAFLCFIASSSASVPSYWLIFGGHQPRNPVYLMQIDSKGTILIPPKKVLRPNQFGRVVGAAAIAHFGESKLHLWRWGQNRNLLHAVIDKTTLTTESIETIDSVRTVDADSLQVTQRLGLNFLMFEDSGNNLSAVELDADGRPSGSRWSLFSNAPDDSDEACLASDGEFAASNRHIGSAGVDLNDRMFVQRLRKDGRPRSNSRRVVSAQDIEACDVSGADANGQRWVAYLVDHGTSPDDLLVAQKISRTGSRVGGQVIMHVPPDRNHDDQNIAIDPARRFVVFTIDGGQYGCPERDVLVFSRLSTTGHAIGDHILLVGCGLISGSIVNMDILREQ